MTVTSYWAEYAWLPSGIARDVSIQVRADGRFGGVQPGRSPGSAVRLPGLVLPGIANAHSHAFHRALRGRTHRGRGSFWSWRDSMYAVAAALDPDSYLRLARAAYAEMALSGVTSVGEFHYLHHAPGGRRYAEPNVMGHALHAAAREAGLRLTLLDACYLAGGLAAAGHLPVNETQRRFTDPDVGSWAARVGAIPAADGLRVGAAIHSVRAVPAPALAELAGLLPELTGARGNPGRVAPAFPLHVHLSEQAAENEACEAFYGLTPTALLNRHGLLGPATTAVHATHLTRSDISTLGASRTRVCFCPSTERDLADGIGPARDLSDSGAPLCLGSDQHAITDLIEEARALELHERLASGERGRFEIGQLIAALTAQGQASIGWDDAGELAPGRRADLVAVRLDTVRTAGAVAEQAILAASAADVDTVVVDGSVVVSGGRHRLGDVAALLGDAIEPLWGAR
jgi:formiminoglutamate deiminase